MPKIILVIGTPGAGKTSIMEGITHGEHSKIYKIVNMGTEMLKEIKNKQMKRDRIRKELSASEILRIRSKVLNGINKMHGNIVIDTHASVKTGNKIIPGFSFAELASLNKVIGIIYVDAEAKDISARRLKDKSREREMESIAEIKMHQSINLSFAVAYLASLNVPMYIVKNQQEMLSKAITDTSNILKSTFGE